MPYANQSNYLSIIKSTQDTSNSSMGYHNHYYKTLTTIQKPKKNTTQNSKIATTRFQLNSPFPSSSDDSHHCVCFEKKSTGNGHFQGKTENTKRKLLFEKQLSALNMKRFC